MIRKLFASIIALLLTVAPVGAQNATVSTFGYVSQEKNAVMILSQVDFQTEYRAERGMEEEVIESLLDDMETIRVVGSMDLKFKSADEVRSYEVQAELDNGVWVDGVVVFARAGNYNYFLLSLNAPPFDVYTLMEEALSTDMMPQAPEGYDREQLDLRYEKKSL